MRLACQWTVQARMLCVPPVSASWLICDEVTDEARVMSARSVCHRLIRPLDGLRRYVVPPAALTAAYP
jgi:hypothetical protein